MIVFEKDNNSFRFNEYFQGYQISVTKGQKIILSYIHTCNTVLIFVPIRFLHLNVHSGLFKKYLFLFQNHNSS